MTSTIESKDLNNVLNVRELLHDKQFITPEALSVLKRTHDDLVAEHKFTETLSGLFRIGGKGLL